MRAMLVVAALVLTALGTGCQEVYLGNPETAKLDDGLLGWWQTDPEKVAADEKGTGVLLCVSALDRHTYFVTVLGFESKDWKPTGQLQGRAWLSDVAGVTALSFEALGPEFTEVDGKPAAKRFANFRLRRKEDHVELSGVEGNAIGEVKTNEAFARSIAELGPEHAFQGGDVYTRFDLKAHEQQVQTLLKGFRHLTFDSPASQPSEADRGPSTQPASATTRPD